MARLRALTSSYRQHLSRMWNILERGSGSVHINLEVSGGLAEVVTADQTGFSLVNLEKSFRYETKQSRCED